MSEEEASQGKPKAEKAEKVDDPNRLPNKVTCSKCKTVVGVRHIVYAKRVEKKGQEMGLKFEAPTDENLDKVKNDPNFIKARKALDESYLCRKCKPKPGKKAKKEIPVV